MKAIILTAGKGSRLQHFYPNMPKGLVPLKGKPILEIIIDDIRSIGISDFILVIGNKSEQIIDYFGNGEKFGIKIQYIKQDQLLGTAHALLQTESILSDDVFLLHLGDAINPSALKINFQSMYDDDYEVSILTSLISNSINKSVGNIIIKNHFVTAISEKSSILNAEHYWAGVILFKNKKIFSKIKSMNISKTGEFELTEAVGQLVSDNVLVRNYTCEKSIDAGTSEGLDECSKYL